MSLSSTTIPSHLAPLAQIACNAPIGVGGLGRHLEALVHLSQSIDALESHYFCPVPYSHDIVLGRATSVSGSRLTDWLRYSPVRTFQGSLSYAGGLAFDLATVRMIHPGGPGFTGFAGQSLHAIRKARQAGRGPLGIVAANSHASNVLRQHSLAARHYPIERSWLDERQARRMLAEYQLADIIFVASEYTRETFRVSGISEEKPVKIPLSADPRYQCRRGSPKKDTFNVVYVGSLTVVKGIPGILEAFTKSAGPEWRLIFVGGWSSRGMRRYMQAYLTSDPRIDIVPGDPLPHLVSTDVAVHPSFDDGFGYAPMEALAVGVPVVVTDHTAMKEHVVDGVNGDVAPAGDVDSLADRLRRLSEIR